MKDNDFRNMVNDPYLYKDCCGGGAMVGADGTIDTIVKETGNLKISTILLLVGAAAAIAWAYSKFVK